MTLDRFNIRDIDWIEEGVSRSKRIIGEKFCPHLQIRYVEIDGEKTFEAHEHQTTQILYFAFGGSGVVTLDDEKIDVEDGLVVTVKPGVCHSVINKGRNPLRILVFEEMMYQSSEQVPYVDF